MVAAAAAVAAASARPPDVGSLGALLHACARGRLLRQGRCLHRRLLLLLPGPGLVHSNHLLNMYAKCGLPELARRVFDGMPERNLVSWTALLTGYAQRGLHDDCFRLLGAMLPHYLPNDFALAAALSSCAGARSARRGCQVHALAAKTSLDANVFVTNSLIAMYSRCGDGGFSDGLLVFRTTPVRNLITWNSMIAGLSLNGQLTRAVELFAHMHRSGIGFDRVTLVTAISACSNLRHCCQLHSIAIKTCFISEVEVATALVNAYSGLGGSVEDCHRLFSGVEQHDIVSWTGIIASCSEKEPVEAMHLFCQLRRDGFAPDRYTFSTVVKASAGFATDRHCSALQSLAVKSGFGDDMVLSNALIHAYARCGSIKPAEGVFEHMVLRDEVSWNSMIKAYAAHGRGREALQAFARMDVPPDPATFVGLLTACSHGGLVNEGQDLFEAMTNVYGIVPQLDHYACMVDILGRAGKLQEAEDLINRMHMEPDSVVWSALLGACRKHGEASIGVKAAKKLMVLEPQNSVGYVMMSNIYCAAGSIADAASVRKEMKDCGLKKQLGLSWIEIGNCVHEFSAGGRRHPQREAIYVELKQLVDKLKEIGYVADTKLVSNEIDEEHKEERLLHHSEKLALAFALMNCSGSQTSVKIMKNIRICEDCHKFIKLTSKCVGKEIVVRDPNRFHHFVDGTCSCGDYW